MDQSWTGRQKLTFAIGTLVMFTAAMSAWGWFSKPYALGFVAWLDDAVGKGWSGALILGAIPVGYFILWASGHFDHEVVVPKKPLWFKILGAIFLGVPAVCIAVFVALVATGAIR